MNSSEFIALTPIITLSGATVLVMLSIAIQRNFMLATSITAGGIIVTLLSLYITWGETPVHVSSLIRVDAIAQFYLALLMAVGLAVLGFCYDYFKDREGENEELPLLLLTALLGSSVLVSSSHFTSFFIGLEMLSISLFVLIGYSLNKARSLEAAIKYLIMSGVSSAFLLMGMALIYAQCGELNFSNIGHYFTNHQAINAMVLGGTILIITGLGFKLSLVPFHLWTPDIYEGAPAPITAFIATVSKGAVFVLLMRYFISSTSYMYTPLITVLSVIAGLSILGGNLLALQQNNVKRLLAYSSIAHIGYLLVAFIGGISVTPELAVEAVTFYLVAYSITTIGAFGVVSIMSTSKLEGDDISLYSGLFWRRPWLAAIFTLMLLSLAGIPLTAGFIGKFYIFTSVAEGQLWELLLAIIFGSGLGLYYYLRIIVIMSAMVDGTKNLAFKPSKDWLSTVILSVLTMLMVWLGLFPSILINVIQLVSHEIK
jgi:NADH-quinone oxidoreductase subunit N